MTREEAMQQIAHSTDFEFRHGKVVVRRVRLMELIDQIEHPERGACDRHVPLTFALAATASRSA